MSSDDLSNVNKMLTDLLNPDNETRRNAEKQLDQLRNNLPALIHCLGKVLLNASDKGVKTLASVLLRRLLEIKEEEVTSKGWASLPNDFKEAIKADIITTVINEADKNQKIKFSDTMSTIAENVFESQEQWPDLVTFIFQGLALDVEPVNLPLIEANLFFVSQIFSYVYEDMIKRIDSFLVAFSHYFRSESLDLKTRTVQVIAEILCIVRKKDSKKFKEYIPHMLETTYKCLSDFKQENNVSYYYILYYKTYTIIFIY
jgi:hypothetical protein